MSIVESKKHTWWDVAYSLSKRTHTVYHHYLFFFCVRVISRRNLWQQIYYTLCYLLLLLFVVLYLSKLANVLYDCSTEEEGDCCLVYLLSSHTTRFLFQENQQLRTRLTHFHTHTHTHSQTTNKLLIRSGRRNNLFNFWRIRHIYI